MLFYNTPTPAPNPRRVRIFLAEKGVTIPTRDIAIVRGEHKSPEFLKINPLGQTPALDLDDGRVLTESVSICRYLESLYPQPPLFGADAVGQAEFDMWLRRIDLRLGNAVGAVWRHTHPFTAAVVKPQHKEYGEGQRAAAHGYMAELNAALQHRDWLAGDAFSMADIVLLATLDFADFIGLPTPEPLSALHAWKARASARPSAGA